MLIRCDFITNPASGDVQSESPWAKVGSDYLVVGIVAGAGHQATCGSLMTPASQVSGRWRCSR